MAKTKSREPEKPVEATDAQVKGARGVTLSVPGVSVRLSVPEVHVPEPARHAVTAAVHKAQAMMPPPEQAAFYVGLGVLAALQLIEWPVAAVIGAGMAVNQRTRTQSESSPARR
jgi:hypothetical protein